MRMMLKARIPVESGNKGIKDGTLPKTMMSVVEHIKPEAAFFGLEDGMRTAYFVFDLKEASQMPVHFEPLFSTLNASLTLTPVMNQADLKTGLETLSRQSY
jgi:hypothetical protein